MILDLPEELFVNLQQSVEEEQEHSQEINDLKENSEPKEEQSNKNPKDPKTVLTGIENTRYKNIGTELFSNTLEQIKEVQEKMSFREKMNTKVLKMVLPVIRTYNNIIEKIQSSTIYGKIAKAILIFSTLFFAISQWFPGLWETIKWLFGKTLDFLVDYAIPWLLNAIGFLAEGFEWTVEKIYFTISPKDIDDLGGSSKKFFTNGINEFVKQAGGKPITGEDKAKERNQILFNYQKSNPTDETYNFVYSETGAMHNLLSVFNKLRTLNGKSSLPFNVVYPSELIMDMTNQEGKKDAIDNAIKSLNDDILKKLPEEVKKSYENAPTDTLIKDIQNVMTGEGSISDEKNRQALKDMLDKAKPVGMPDEEFKNLIVSNMQQAEQIWKESRSWVNKSKPQKKTKKEENTEVKTEKQDDTKKSLFVLIKEKIQNTVGQFQFSLTIDKQIDLPNSPELSTEETTIEQKDDSSFQIIEEKRELLSLNTLKDTLTSQKEKLEKYIEQLKPALNNLRQELS